MELNKNILYYDFVEKVKVREDVRRVADWVCATCEDEFKYDSYIDVVLPELLIFDNGVVVCHECAQDMSSILASEGRQGDE